MSTSDLVFIEVLGSNPADMSSFCDKLPFKIFQMLVYFEREAKGEQILDLSKRS